MFKATDGGASWTPTNTGLAGIPVFSLAIDPKTPTTVYAGTFDGVLKSPDGGGTWTGSNSGLPASTRVFALAAGGD